MEAEDIAKVILLIEAMADDADDTRPDSVPISTDMAFTIVSHVGGVLRDGPDLTAMVSDKWKVDIDKSIAWRVRDFAAMGYLVFGLHECMAYDAMFVLPQQFAADFMQLLVRPAAAYSAHLWFIHEGQV